MSDLLYDLALTYARSGLHVFPCRPGRKEPATQHGLLDATTDAYEVVRWWDRAPKANVAIACGPSDLVVIDLDGAEGTENWKHLSAEHGFVWTPCSALTPRGGSHLYYRADPERPVKSTASKLAKNIDTRAVGGYVLAPPSRTHVGAYQWVGDPITDVGVSGLPTVPAWIFEALRSTQKQDLRRDGTVTYPARYAYVAFTNEIQRVLDAEEGHRNDALNKAAFALGRFVIARSFTQDQVEGALTLAGQSIGLDDGEIAKTIGSGLKRWVAA